MSDVGFTGFASVPNTDVIVPFNLTGFSSAIDINVGVVVHVLDRFGVLVPNVTIEIYASGGALLFSEFTSSGVWAFELPSAATYEISLSNSGKKQSFVYDGITLTTEYFTFYSKFYRVRAVGATNTYSNVVEP